MFPRSPSVGSDSSGRAQATPRSVSCPWILTTDAGRRFNVTWRLASTTSFAAANLFYDGECLVTHFVSVFLDCVISETERLATLFSLSCWFVLGLGQRSLLLLLSQFFSQFIFLSLVSAAGRCCFYVSILLMMSHSLIHLPPAHYSHPTSHIQYVVPGSKLTFSTNLFHYSLLAHAGLPSRTILDRTHSTQRYSLLVIFLSYFYFESCVRLSWLNRQPSSTR